MIRVEIIGNLGADATIKEFGDQKYVSFSVGSNEVSKDEQGNRVEHTQWVSVLWRGEGGGLFPFLKKGTKVFVRGDLRVKQYKDSTGAEQVSLNLGVREIELCGGTPTAKQ